MSWNGLNNAIKNCQQCQLHQNRKNAVVGGGSKEAILMIVGEAPGYNEDIKGEPFVGKAGQLLDNILQAIDLKREEVYITNVVKCRPPKNREPLEEEISLCIPYLRKQFLLIRPKIILCLGRVAAQALINKDFKVSQEHGKFFERKSCSIMATYHPAALLRDLSKKRTVWEDMKRLMERYEDFQFQ